MSPTEAVDGLDSWPARIESLLDQWLPCPEGPTARLAKAMRHAVLGGGKRMRPSLVYAAGTACGARLDQLDHAAAAVELIHVYSLIHDDLPAMDDDSLRRGKPTVHVAFDEATAILAGDALQSLAFDVLSQAPLSAASRLEMVQCLSRASGHTGMCGGQAIDVEAVGTTGAMEITSLRRMHALKTGALIEASVQLGAIAAGAAAPTRDALGQFARELGLAFQIKDDLLDVESDSATLGKTAGKDAAGGKPTYVSLLGLNRAREELAILATSMRDRAGKFGGEADCLSAIADVAINRTH